MPGTIEDPVKLDPFQNIIEVGWGGPFVLLGIYFQGEGIGGMPEDANTWYMRFQVKRPLGHDDIWIGRNEIPGGEHRFTEYPEGETDFKKQLASQGEASIVFREDPIDVPLASGVWSRIFFFNFSIFLRMFGAELINEGPPGLPGSARWGYYDGNIGIGPGTNKVAIQLYSGSALHFMSTYHQDRLSRINAAFPTQVNPGVTTDEMIGFQAIPGAEASLQYHQDFDIQTPGTQPGTNIDDFFWDVFQRNNRIAYPDTNGAKPQWHDAI